MIINKYRCFLIGLILTTSPAAAGVSCSGVVTKVSLQPEGTAFVEFGYGMMRLCEMNMNLTVYRGPNAGGNTAITPTTCQALYASFLTAKSSGKTVVASIDSNSCPTALDGTVPNPYPAYFHFP